MPTLQVTHNSTNITNYILDYKRELDICTGIGTITILVAKTYSSSFEVWDTVEVYEDGTKRGEFNVGKISKDSESHSTTVFCQDNSKRLADYFVAEAYYINYYTTTRYWIEKFMNDAGVGYSFTTTSVGPPLSKETTLGIESAYEIIVTMLQQSGWYMYFNDSGNAVIGKFSLDLSNYKKSFNDDDILSITKTKDDKMLRNRAVVWGNAQVETGEWVFADLRRNTTWNYDQNDWRTVLFSNHDILNNTIALDLANQILEEFCRITQTKTVVLHGFHNVHIGDVVLLKSKYHNGIGLVTSLNVTANKDGYITTLVLDERCPRLFSYYGFDSGKVYCGTAGSGVWEKPLDGSTWSDFSTGIADLNIKDLAIANGVFACVTNSGQAYIRDIADSSWTLLTYGDFLDETDSTVTSASTVTAKACAVNRATSEVYILFQSPSKAWVGLIVNKVLIGTKQVYLTINGIKYPNLFVFDVDTDDRNVFVTAGVGNLPGTLFSTYQFPIIEAFTHNDKDEFRTFETEDMNVVSRLVWDYGKVHAAGAAWNPTSGAFYPNSGKFQTFDFSGTSIVETKSPIITISGGISTGASLALSQDTTSLYLANWNGYSFNDIYKHTIGSSTVTNVTACTQDYYDKAFANLLYTIDYYEDGGERVYRFNWYDIETQQSDILEFARLPIYDNMWVGSGGGGVGEDNIWFHYDTIGYFFSYIGKNNNNPQDNFVYGCCSYDDQYFANAYLVGFFFNVRSKNSIRFSKLVHPGPDVEPSDNVCTSHADPSTSANYQKIVARWAYINYGEGIPYIVCQYTIADNGPWVWNPSLGYYEYLTHREGYAGTNVYPRIFIYNALTDQVKILDDAKLNTAQYATPPVDDYLAQIILGNTNYYVKQGTASITTVEQGWKTAYQEFPSNTHMKTWDLISQYLVHTGQHKMDYFYNEYPVVNWRTSRYNQYGQFLGYRYWFQTYPPDPYAGRPINSTSGWSKCIILENTNSTTSINNQDCSQNVFAVRWTEGLSENWWKFYQFGDWLNFIQNAYVTTVNTTSGFQIIDLTTLPHVLEVGASGPVVTYAKSISGMITRDGIPDGKLRVGLYSPSGLLLPSSYTLGGNMPSGMVPNYSFVTPSGEYTVIMDARPFNMNPSTQLPLNSGYLTSSGITVIGIAMDNAIHVKRVDQLLTSGWDALVVLSENTTNFETTNFFPSPYLFTATTSGIVPSGISIVLSGISKFYQRNPYTTAWVNMSPIVSSYITCIRADDRL